MKYKNRDEAGTLLAEKLEGYADLNPVVLALPRGGVPVAHAIAKKLHAPLDICLVKKIPAPGSEEFAIGAIAEDEKPELNEDYIEKNKLNRDSIAEIISKRITEIRKRSQMYRAKLSKVSLKNKAVIVVDDGLATGASMLAAVKWLRTQEVKKIIVAVPIASTEGAADISRFADEFVSLITSDQMWAVGLWYENFKQVSDAEVLHMLEQKKWIPKNAEQKHKKQLSLEEEIHKLAHPFKNSDDLKDMVAKMAKHKIVMLGEATHGTKEYYEMRREISKILIRDHGFSFVAVEGDWPDCMKLNELIDKGREANTTDAVRKSFHRWPTWMWSNEEIPPLIDWMAKEKKGAFHGLDVYSLFESLDVIKGTADKFSPEMSRQINEAYDCFEEFADNEIKYAESLLKIPAGCKKEVVSALREVLRVRVDQTKLNTKELFNVQQNARVIHNAEKYYRTMLYGGSDSWNIRDMHMLETLENLLNFYGPDSKAIVWAHNTHVGDYHATDMLEEGSINLGGIAREKFGMENVFLLGFGSYKGEVTAGSAWGADVETMPLPEAKSGSWEDYFHRACQALKSDKFFLNMRETEKETLLAKRLGHRAVGVVYKPRLEQFGSNYVPTKMSERYDGFIFIDVTNALRPIQSTFVVGEFPETYPAGQ
jgi:erythromycin esterase